jgi:hypothetical protein
MPLYGSCELLLLEVGSSVRKQFGKAEEGERPPLETATSNGSEEVWTVVCL